MEQSAAHLPDPFAHIRIIMGFIVSLAMARLLTGIARFIQHPGSLKVDAVHLAWSAGVFVLLVHFWWWEFWLGAITHWTFALYAFLVAFALQLYLLAALLYPDNIAEYDGYGDYFLKRRAWFFCLIASVQVFDVIDTLIKGDNHASQYHWTYWAQDGGTFVLALAAMAIANRRFQLAFAALNLAVQLWFIATNFTTLG